MANAVYPIYKTAILSASTNVSLTVNDATDGPFCQLSDTGVSAYSEETTGGNDWLFPCPVLLPNGHILVYCLTYDDDSNEYHLPSSPERSTQAIATTRWAWGGGNCSSGYHNVGAFGRKFSRFPRSTGSCRHLIGGGSQ